MALSVAPLFLAAAALILASKCSDYLAGFVAVLVLLLTIYSLAVGLSGFLSRNAEEAAPIQQIINNAQQDEDGDTSQRPC